MRSGSISLDLIFKYITKHIKLGSNSCMFRRYLTIGIIFLFITSGLSIAKNDNVTSNTNRDDTLYVGGSGPGNYTTIQSAITASNDGDTVYVYSGVYNETLTVSKSITLMGEDRNTTIIDGKKQDSVVKITQDGVIVRGFTLKESRYTGVNWLYNVITIRNRVNIVITDNIIQIGLQEYNSATAGIYLEDSSNVIISNNIIINIELVASTAGIAIYGISSYNYILSNEIGNHLWGIKIPYYTSISKSYVNFTEITNNTIFDNQEGIEFGGGHSTLNGNIINNNKFRGLVSWYGKDNSITHNVITENGVGHEFSCGLWIWETSENLIAFNTLSSNVGTGLYFLNADSNQIIENHLEENTVFGLLLQSSYNNIFRNNNFVRNEKNAYFEYSFPIIRRLTMPNNWDGNYWSDQLLKGVIPKVILGKAVMTIFIQVPWVQVDWKTLSEPKNV